MGMARRCWSRNSSGRLAGRPDNAILTENATALCDVMMASKQTVLRPIATLACFSFANPLRTDQSVTF